MAILHKFVSKKISLSVFFVLLILMSLFRAESVVGEIAVRTSVNDEDAGDIAYNPTRDEYLAVWTEWVPSGGFHILGPVMGQRVNGNGTLKGSAFQIFAVGALPKVAYNEQRDEYLVVCSYAGVQSQRIDSAGQKLGASDLIIADLGWPQVEYNSLANEYLVTGALLTEVQGAPGFCTIKISSRRVGWDGQKIGHVYLVAEKNHGICDDGAIYSIAYAPITSGQTHNGITTPKGRYLVAIDTPGDLIMLDSNGWPMQTLYNPQSSIYYNSVPFQLSKLGVTHDVDVAFGYWAGEPNFLVVWSDRQQTYNNFQWTGIWGGLVDATNINYLTTQGVTNTTFPISFINSHLATTVTVKEWKPKASYNSGTKKFMVAWRETPGTDPQNDTHENHIRANSIDANNLPPQQLNVVLSRTNGDENPQFPAIAANSKTGGAFVVWEDWRNQATTSVDMYGAAMANQVVESLKLTVPNGNENWQVGSNQTIQWTSTGLNTPVKLDYSTDGGNNFTTITNSTANSGSYSWTVPNTPSTSCLVRVHDAADGQPFDVSDAVFTIVAAPQNTPKGKNVNVSPGTGINMTFDEITGAGNTTVDLRNTGAPPPNGFTIYPKNPPLYYSIKTTATFKNNIKICITYDDTQLTPLEESRLRFFVNESPPGKWVDITVSRDTQANIICGQVNHLTDFAFMIGPVHFAFRYETGDSYSIVVDQASLNQVPLQNGDEIGVFTPAGLCVGAAVWDGTAPLALTAWADDSQTSEVDGYVAGEKMSFRIWDENDDSTADFLAITTYSVGNGNFGDGAFARISHLDAVSFSTQTLALSQGWSWVSFNVQPDRPAMEVVMANVTNLGIVVDGAGNFYIPNVINSIGDWDITEGYKVYLTAPDQVEMSGPPIAPTTPISLNAGWSFISYLPAVSLSAETAASSILSQLAIVKNDAGNFFIPNVINSLGNMQPGEGYKLYLNSTATLIYPQGTLLSKRSETFPPSQKGSTQHFRFKNRTGDSYSIVVQSLAINGNSQNLKGEIGVFTEQGLCVGAGVWDGGSELAIAAWSDNVQTESTDGFKENQSIMFKYWNANLDQEFELTSDFSKGSGAFGDGPYALVNLDKSQLPQTFSLAQNYPNPFNAGTIISYQIPETGNVLLEIYNVLGQEVTTLIDKNQEAGVYQVQWQGTDRYGNLVPSGVYLYKISVGGYSALKKAAYLK